MTLFRKIASFVVILSAIFSPLSVFAGNQLIATIKGTGATAQVYSVSTDHLTGSNVVTNSSGTIEELMDYYPYGDIRLDEKAGSFNEQRKFAGHEYDVDTSLSYMNARYYNGKIGRFVSQDPAFWDFSHAQVQLVDPQSWNSYAYARNNPLINIDESGQFWDTVLDTATTYYDSVRYGERMMVAAAGAVNIGIGTAMNNQGLINAGDAQLSQGVQGMNSLRGDIAMDAAGTAIPGVPILGLKAVGKVDDVGKAIKSTDGIVKNIDGIFRRAAEHSDARNHYPGKSVQEIENIAKNTYNNFDIKVNIKDIKKYFYNAKTNDLFINNPKNPTIFKPDKGLDYLKSTVKKDIARGGGLK
jgi:RHS repeat-associated protein